MPSTGGDCGPPQAQWFGPDSSTSPRNLLRFGSAMPARNSAENLPTAVSSRPSRRRPAAVYATCQAASPENGPAVVTRGSNQDSSARAAAWSAAANRVNRAARSWP